MTMLFRTALVILGVFSLSLAAGCGDATSSTEPGSVTSAVRGSGKDGGAAKAGKTESDAEAAEPAETEVHQSDGGVEIEDGGLEVEDAEVEVHADGGRRGR